MPPLIWSEYRFLFPLLMPFILVLIQVFYSYIYSYILNSCSILRIASTICSTMCFACLTIDIWVLTISNNLTTLTGFMAPQEIFLQALIFLMLHVLFHGLCLGVGFMIGRMEMEHAINVLKGLLLMTFSTFFVLVSIYLAIILRLNVWRVYYV